MSPMAAPQALEEGPERSAFPAPCLSNQEFAKPLVCKTEAPAVSQRKLGSGIFTPQLWKAVGLVPKQLEPTPVQCAALTTPKSASASVRPPLPPPFSSGSGRRLMSGSTFSGELSFGSVSSTGCVSIHMASCDINPKSLKSAAIMAFEASAAEGSDASGALSDSTGVSPGHLHGGGGGVVTSGRPLGGPGRQRSLGLSGGSSLSREAGPVAAPVAGSGSGPAAAAAAAAAAASPPYLQHVASGASHSSFGASGGGGCVAGGGGAAGWNVATPGLAAAPSLAARSDGGSTDTAIVYTGDLHECLLCGLKSCFPTGPATIRCSDCKGTMHRDCFIAHYQVVPGRRDWTYCPVHSQVLKNRLPAKPRPAAAAPRRGPRDKDPRPQQQHRKRSRPDGGAMSDAAGDREFTAGLGFERVPSGSRSQRARRAAIGGSAALAAAGMAVGGGDGAVAAGSGAFSAVASPASSDGGNGDAAAADADALPPPQRRFVSSRGRESRPVRRQYDSDIDAEAATPRAGGAARGGLLSESPPSGDGAAACGASPMDTDDAAAAPSSPTGNSVSGSAAEPDSPSAAHAAVRAGNQTAGRRSAANAADGKAGPPALSVGRSRSVARPQQAGMASPRGPTSPRLRAQPPHSPRAGNGSHNGSGSQQKGDDGGSGGSRKAAARSNEASRGREQRPVPASPRARAMPKQLAAAAAAPAAAAPSPAKTPAELNDEELAMLLHQELNAPSRRRGQRLPGAL